MYMDGKVTGAPLFRAANATVIGNVTLGRNVGIWFGAVIRADKDRIVIGDRSNIQDNCVVHTSTGHPVTVGCDVSVGHGAILHGCTVQDRVLVGMGAIILNGAVVGEGSVIGAGAVVTEGMTVPPGSVVVGIPARIIKPATEEQQKHILANAATYVDLAGEYARHG
jgi:carbonic anhydrase/acetyltransferase-like protein (isoleucine patch superfamily)